MNLNWPVVHDIVDKPRNRAPEVRRILAWTIAHEYPDDVCLQVVVLHKVADVLLCLELGNCVAIS